VGTLNRHSLALHYEESGTPIRHGGCRHDDIATTAPVTGAEDRRTLRARREVVDRKCVGRFAVRCYASRARICKRAPSSASARVWHSARATARCRAGAAQPDNHSDISPL